MWKHSVCLISNLCLLCFVSFIFLRFHFFSFLPSKYFLRLFLFVFIIKNYLFDWFMNVCNKKSLSSTSFQYELILETLYCIWRHCDGSLHCPFTYLHFYDGEWRSIQVWSNAVFLICPKQEQRGQIFVRLILSYRRTSPDYTALQVEGALDPPSRRGSWTEHVDGHDTIATVGGWEGSHGTARCTLVEGDR